MDPKKVEWEGNGLDWSGSGQRQVAGTSRHDNEPSVSIKCGNFLISWELVSFSRNTLLHAVSKYSILQLSGKYLLDGLHIEDEIRWTEPDFVPTVNIFSLDQVCYIVCSNSAHLHSLCQCTM
jgi:hypothetical protein